MKAAFLVSLVALAAPVAAQAPDWSKAKPIAITMTDDGYVPSRIVLARGGLYELRVANRSGKGHNLTQEAFFHAARVAPGDRRRVADGQIVLKEGERTAVRFRAPMTRPGGRFQFSSTVLADANSEYKGVFIMR